MAEHIGKPRKYVRVIDGSDGSVIRSPNGHGREIDGLSYHAASGRYYCLDPATGKRRYLGRDLAPAIKAVTPRRAMVLQQTGDKIAFQEATPMPSGLPAASVETTSACWTVYEQTIQATPFDKDAIAPSFARLAKDAKVTGKTFKCFRNIPGSIMHSTGLAEWLAQALLGHTPTTVLGRHYAEQPNANDLIPLVKAIGEAYF